MFVSKEIQTQIESVDVWMGAMQVEPIKNAEGYMVVVERTKEVKRKVADFESLRTSITKPINEALSNINALFKRPADKLKAYEAGLKRMLDVWDNEQERIRIEAQRQKDEAARKEREALQKQADKAEAKGDVAKAEAVRMQAATVVSEEVKKPVPATGTGVSFRMKYEVEVKDKKAFAEWCLAQNNLCYLTVNESMLTKEAQAAKGEKSWPGIAINPRRVTSVTA